MGNYIDSTLLTERMTESRLDSLCKVSGTAKTALLESVITRAESLIDGYAATRYQTPLPSNDLTEEWALAIAEYELYKRGAGAEVPPKIKQSYDGTIALLKDLSAGILTIPSDPKPEPLNSSGSSITVKSSDALMNDENMHGF
ncbi:MAG: hypothetical protein A2017_08755 [Lentisphaerae bacterium GWF2_44_16]|nr:MAG: hypothetical protein A2017_08755 [Lentisphaerae bacterium GWF2_44_16]